MSAPAALAHLKRVTQVAGKQQWKACCPVHDDKKPSLTVTEMPDGKLLAYCHAGCSQDALLAAIPELVPERRERHERGDFHDHVLGDPSSIWRYRAADRSVLGIVARYETTDGKEVRPWKRNGIGWKQGAMPVPRPIFNLDKLAADPTARVLVVEGEKCADVAGRLFPEMVVTTWPGGAKAVGNVDLSPLKGRDVTLWPDNDAPGRAAMLEVQRAVGGRLVELPAGKPEGWDVADATEAEARELVKVPEPRFLADIRASLIADLEAGPEAIDAAEPPQFVVHELLPVCGANLAGAGGVSKTTLALVEAVHVVSGGELYGRPVLMQGPAVHLFAEDGVGYGRYQLQRILADGQACGALPAGVVTRSKRDVRLVGWSRSRFGPLVLVDREGNAHRAPAFDLLLEVLAAYQPVYVTLDPSVLLGPGEDRGNGVDGVWASMVHEAARELHACVQLVDHVSQAVARTQIVDQHAARGGTAKTDNARLARQLVRPAPGEALAGMPAAVTSEDIERRRLLQLHWTKANYSPLPPFAWLRRRGHWIEHLRAVSAEEAADRARAEMERRCAEDVETMVAFVADGLSKGMRWSKSALAEEVTIPDASGVGLTKRRKLEAVGRALASGMLVLRELPAGERRGARREYLSTSGSAP